MIIKQGKTNIKYLFIVIILAIIAGGVMIFTTELIKCPCWWPSSQQVTTTEDQTTDWNSYRSEEYRFEFKYPPTWEFNEEESTKKVIIYYDKSTIDSGFTEGIVISFFQALSLDKLIEEQVINLKSLGNIIENITDLTIDNQPAKLIKSYDIPSGGKRGNRYSNGYYITLPNPININSETYKFIYLGLLRKNEDVISTFRFIE